MNGKDFLLIRDFSPSEIQYLLVLGRQVKADPTAFSNSLRRQTLAMIFEKPSLRTRVSFDVGIQQLGGFPFISLLPRSILANASLCTTWRRIWNVWCKAS